METEYMEQSGMTDTQAAEQYRLKQAERLLQDFERAHGRAARSIEELSAWVATGRGDSNTN
jgi:hypothetical protein